MWTSLFTIEYFFVASMAAYLEKVPLSILALHHILFQVTLVMNVVVMVIYWSLLYRLDMKRDIIASNPFRQWLQILIHFWPFFSVALNFLYSEVTMKKNQGYFLIPITLAYITMNYFGTLAIGKPIYPFLDWNNP